MRSPSNHPRSRKPRAAFAPSLIALAVILACQPARATLDIPNAPLQSAAAIPSNILYILDDSGSMQFEMMPDDLVIFPEDATTASQLGTYLFPPPNRTLYGSDTYGWGNASQVLIPAFDDTSFQNFYKRSSYNNTVYYDPTITYTPWVKYDGSSYGNASPSAAPWHPANTGAGTINLTAQQTATANWITGASLTGWASTCGWGGSCSSSYYPITFYVYKGSGSTASAASYIRYQIRGTTGYQKDLNGGTNTTVTSFNWGSVSRTVAEEAQNFANWFSYYRSRTLAARAGSSIAFSKLGTNYRVGFTTINTASFGDAIPTSGVFESTNRQTWFNNLFTNPVPTSGTPLKQALNQAGQYYSRSDNTGPYGPSPQLSCRRNFTILTTDGYYGDTTIAGIANEDGTAGTTISGTGSQTYKYAAVKPYQDSYTNTLADIAMYYWKNDLRTDLANNMRATSTNPSFWQNMNTFTLSLGPQGTLNPATDLARLTAGTVTWPNPLDGNAQKIDDLWHAAINGRGSFVAAKNPTEFANGLVSALTTIGKAGGVWNVAVTSFALEAAGRTFVARYDGNWGGDLWAVAYNANGQMNTTSDGTPIPVWKASANVPAAASRKIFTWKDSGGGGTAFEYTNLSSSKKSAMGSTAVVDYLRGVRTGEVANGGAYRNRSSVLGDFANPAPVYVKSSNTLFIPGNDGMLHAFNATNGVELFAYIPGSVNFTDLASLSNPNYSHKYLNDGELAVSDATLVGKNILVGSLGRAGKGIYALDVSSPSAFGSGNVLWEYTDSDLGQTLGKPVIVKLNTGVWAVLIGNGYNSTNEKAFLYVLNLETGALIKKIATGAGSSTATNGLASLVGFDKEGDGKVDLVYAGDLLGNFWRFNLAGTDTSAWSATSMFTARDASNNTQPITGGLSVAIDPKTNKRWVFGGTGRYLTNADVSDNAIQTWYGLIDDGTAIASRSALTQRTLTAETAQGTYLTRTFSEATANDMVGKSGWYVDLAIGGVKSGERIVSRSQYSAGVLYASSIIPSTDKCASGGSGYINALSAFSGATLVKPFFDINNDSTFDDADKKLVGGKLTPAGSVRTGGMIGEITIKKVTDSKFTIQSCDSTGACKAQPNVNLTELRGRVSWREIRKE
jgi:type IV pilus assembly protein PilY1